MLLGAEKSPHSDPCTDLIGNTVHGARSRDCPVKLIGHDAEQGNRLIHILDLVKSHEERWRKVIEGN